MKAPSGIIITLLFMAMISLPDITSDLDDDGLPDLSELLVLKTNPLNPDSDFDGILDAKELQLKTSPTRDPFKKWSPDSAITLLTPEHRKTVRNVIHTLDIPANSSKEEVVWAVLKWVDENIQYNDAKAQLVEETHQQYLQSPDETIKEGKGICTDYTLLITALLLEAGITPVYIIDVQALSTMGHTVPAVMIDGQLYVLDQNLPLICLCDYDPPVDKILFMTYMQVELDAHGNPKITNRGVLHTNREVHNTDIRSNALKKAISVLLVEKGFVLTELENPEKKATLKFPRRLVPPNEKLVNFIVELLIGDFSGWNDIREKYPYVSVVVEKEKESFVVILEFSHASS